jgi:hypothetical protein
MNRDAAGVWLRQCGPGEDRDKIASGFGSKEQLSYDYDANSNRTAETRKLNDL